MSTDLPVVGLDLDGVLWRGEDPVPGAADAVARLREAGHRVAFLTNNANPTVEDYAAKLDEMGVEAAPDELVTSAQAAAAVLADALAPGARVHACGGPGLVEALERAGFEAVDHTDADAVVVGFDRGFDFQRLSAASAVVRAGARFVATNVDPTYPDRGRLVPGNGALVAAVATAGGRQPLVAGKPHPPYAQLVRARFGDAGVMVGDRPSTDGALADALGWSFALVLTGVAGAEGGEPIPDPPPELVADDLAALVEVLLAT